MNKTWSSQSATTSLRISASARKRAQVGSSSAATQVINEPKPDWVFPSLAPFYCFSGDYIRSATAWADALQAKVQDVTHTSLWADALEAEARRILKRQESCHAERSSLFAEWSLDHAPEAPGAWITSMGVQTSITPGSILVMPVSPGDGLIDFVKSIDRWAVVGASKAMLSYREWDEGTFGHKFSSPEEKLAAQCHRQLLKFLFSAWDRNFARAVEFGTAHIMARKRSVLAPFERVTWNQWQYFRLDKKPPSPEASEWGDPRRCQFLGDVPWTATGPAGERLYEIHIAPGDSVQHDRLTAEQRVIAWLLKLLKEYPDEPPQPLPNIRQFVMEHFSELSIKIFDHCYRTACQQTGNYNWSNAGRRKSPRSPLSAPQFHIIRKPK